jgi:hypothetical protein
MLAVVQLIKSLLGIHGIGRVNISFISCHWTITQNSSVHFAALKNTSVSEIYYIPITQKPNVLLRIQFMHSQYLLFTFSL